MSLASKLTFAASCVFSAGLVAYVHRMQYEERKALHDPVLRYQEAEDLKKEALKELEKENNAAAQDLVNLTRTGNPTVEKV
jgi:hypothetical protein